MNTSKSETLMLSNAVQKKLMAFYADQQVPSKNSYIVFMAKVDECSISVYSTGKVLFQGTKADAEAAIWRSIDQQSNTPLKSDQAKHPKQAPALKEERSKTPTSDQNVFVTHAGSDEVGTGDYFGPVCVCACIVPAELSQMMKDLGVDDSKQMNDAKIREIAPLLREKLVHSLLVLDNKTYNKVHAQYNMNGVKAMLHNKAYLHLRSKANGLPPLSVVDQFAPEDVYYRYLSQEKDIVRQLHFETKAESKYLAVACASVIARDAFLEAMDQMSSQYGITLLKGASKAVDDVAKQLVARSGVHVLEFVAKVHFANTKKVLD